MHIPKLYNRRGWQRFFVGTFFGAVFAYLALLYMHGSMQEEMLREQLELSSRIKELERQNKSLLADKEDLDDLRIKETTITDIEVKIMNKDKLKLDRLLRHQLEEIIIDEIEHLIGETVDTVAKSDTLLVSTIENKIFSIDDFSYKMEIKKLVISQKIYLEMNAKLPK